MSDSRKSSVKPGRSTEGESDRRSSRQPPLEAGRQRPSVQRHLSGKEGSVDDDDAFTEDAGEMSTSRNQLRKRVG